MCRLLVVLLLLPVAALAQPKKGTQYAFIVAVSKYDEATTGLKPLPFTIKDVTGFRDALLATGYEAKNIRLLHDELPADQNPSQRFAPKQKEIMAELARLLKFAEPNDSVIVVLNGHGVHFKDAKTSHFCPLDADLIAKENLLPMDGVGGLYPLLEKCKAKSKLLIAGMCRNDPKDFPAANQAATQIDLSTPEKPPEGIAALYSCEAGQRTYFDKDKGSYFFNHLTAAWKGEYSGGDELTLDSVFADVRARTKKDVFDVTGGLRDQFPEVRRKYDGAWLISKPSKPSSKGALIGSIKKLDPVAKPSVLGTPKAGEERDFEIKTGLKMRFCWIPAGKSALGSPRTENKRDNDEAIRQFETNGFWMGKYEVMQSEWESVMERNESRFKGAKLPVETVSWDECQDFITRCDVLEMSVKMPHEDQWEYACRGGKGNLQAFYWGGSLNGDKANCRGDRPYGTTSKGADLERTTEAGRYELKAPHPWKLCDMHGNVSEFCENLYPGGFNDHRVVRGGNWWSGAEESRSARRYHIGQSPKNDFIGFRIILIPKS